MKSLAPRRSSVGFTLVELLVVISIIVVLVAILVPALAKANYEAQFASCGASQDGVGTGILQYAMDNNRKYPIRNAYEYFQYVVGGNSTGGVGYRTYWVLGILKVSDSSNTTVNATTNGAYGGGPTDDRPRLKKYMSLKALGDPFCDKVDYEDPELNTAGTIALSSIDMWWAFGYVGEQKMTKMGNAITWKNGTTGKTHEWRILASDRAVFRADLPVALSSHPDLGGKLELQTEKGETTYVAEGTTYRIWDSEYVGDPWDEATFARGVYDYNYLYDDGSVVGIRKITNGKNDPRVAVAPIWRDPALEDYNTNYHLMPSGDR